MNQVDRADDTLARSRWSGAWLDAVALAIGLGLAWFLRWETTDLVWSLWLSSFAVGYATIVWTITRGLRDFLSHQAKDGKHGREYEKFMGRAFVGLSSLFFLAFFSFHFGGFHYVHSVFLKVLFPLAGQGVRANALPDLAHYAEVVQRYWLFLPAAFIAERRGFVGTPAVQPARAAATRFPSARPAPELFGDRGALIAPYKNVIRMHLLIFFFAAASAVQLDNFVVYATVYAVYFFPWRMLPHRGARSGSPFANRS